jgi:hypothetical protein
VIGISRDLYDSPVFLMNQDAAGGHTSFANRSDNLFFHVSPPLQKYKNHDNPFPIFYQTLFAGVHRTQAVFAIFPQ